MLSSSLMSSGTNDTRLYSSSSEATAALSRRKRGPVLDDKLRVWCGAVERGGACRGVKWCGAARTTHGHTQTHTHTHTHTRTRTASRAGNGV
jgi:hypothetical protein